VTGAGGAGVLWARGAGGASAIRQVTDELFPGDRRRTTRRCRSNSSDWKPRIREAGPQPARTLIFGGDRREELIGRRVRAVVDKLCGGSLAPLLSHLAQAGN